MAQAPGCNPAHPRSIRGRVSNTQVAQLAERPTVNGERVGSRPTLGAKFPTEGRNAGVLTGLENRDGPGDRPCGFEPHTFRQHRGSSVVERGAENARGAGSIPALGTTFNASGSSTVEQRSPKPPAVGSNPTRRATFWKVNRAGAPGPFAKRIGRGRHRGCGSSPSPSAIFNACEATAGCVAADCNPAHQKHRWFDSNRTHHLRLRITQWPPHVNTRVVSPAGGSRPRPPQPHVGATTPR